MKKIVTLLITIVFVLSSIASNVSAQEEFRGKELLNNLQENQVECNDLSNDDFQALGEYYMRQMAGESYEQMNAMMTQTMGEENEEQMHMVMGKRLSGCDTSVEMSSQSFDSIPMMVMMMNMMGVGNNSMMENGNMMNGMMGGMWAFGLLGLITWILFITVLVLLAVYLWKQIQKK